MVVAVVVAVAAGIAIASVLLLGPGGWYRLLLVLRLHCSWLNWRWAFLCPMGQRIFFLSSPVE